MIKKFTRSLLASAGYSLIRLHDQVESQPTLGGAIHRLALRQPQFQTVVDVGAAVGDWSAALAATFPGREHLLIEANDVHAAALQTVCRRNDRWKHVIKACGPAVGRVHFNGQDPLGGQARLIADDQAQTELAMTTIDHELQVHGQKPPFLIKLDTHGFELPILEGAAETLRQTEVLVIEAYNFTIGPQAVRFWELCEYLKARGFLPIDMFDLLYRSHDHALWQMDVMFMRSSWPGFQNHSYSGPAAPEIPMSKCRLRRKDQNPKSK